MGLLGRTGLRRAERLMLRRWSRLAEQSPPAGAGRLRRLRAEARALRDAAQRVLSRSEAGLALGAPGDRQDLPPRTDWHWRPAPWCARDASLSRTARPDTERPAPLLLGPGIALFHDCPLGEICAAQGAGHPGAAPCALRIEVFGFSGSFLSLAVDLPPEALAGLGTHHVLRVDIGRRGERPAASVLRLNIRHGPNTAQIAKTLAAGHGPERVEFDLAYAELDEKRITHAWIDILMEEPRMNEIIIDELRVSRHRRVML
ncbi:DUF6478 family protein [Profundibacterium mesophilum]|uniref:Uncharacterized protein n=1 Tax=Profundibacterium mesophilum KAUST100406-0324 TaxID=1037889 RepID=A0A921TGD1_9RHOB|nr:DUF6478 family protein [Profundibacterium mesophilum]KAF0677324.1 hypothetical protein PMES_00371 [Profundibacterium mesophilum KAUST100406-0324]